MRRDTSCCTERGAAKRTSTVAEGLWAEDRFKRTAVLPPALLGSRTAMLTPGVTTTARELETQIYTRCGALGADIARTLRLDISPELSPASPRGTELLIVDLSRHSDYPEGAQRAALDRLLGWSFGVLKVSIIQRVR